MGVHERYEVLLKFLIIKWESKIETKVQIIEGETKPPKRLTESQLIGQIFLNMAWEHKPLEEKSLKNSK